MNWQMPPVVLLVIWIIWVLQPAWASFNVWNYLHRARRLARRKDRRDDRHGAYTPRVAVIIPVKGADTDLHGHAAALSRQDYPEYRLIFVVESGSDPAHAALQRLAPQLSRPVTIVVAGRAAHGGQKVHNLLCAMRELSDEDEVVVFADADAVPHDQWLHEIVEPLRRESVAASTGYRWMVPADAGAADLPTCLACILNGSIATLLGPLGRNHAWGGSMAILRRTIEQVKLIEHWTGAVSDDYQLSHAVKQTTKSIFFVPRCLVVSPIRHTWETFLEFARRQYIITRIHAPLLWLAALLITGLYTLGLGSMLAAVALRPTGWSWGLAAFAGVFVLDNLRAALRRRAVVELLGIDVSRRLAHVWRLEHRATPLWMPIHFLIVLSTAVGRRITWARITYDIRSRTDVHILRRDA